MNEKTVGPIFAKIFADCAHGHQPMLWKDWPLAWQVWQRRLLVNYYNTTPWQGQMPTPGHPVLPVEERLWKHTETAIAQHELPQYYIGAFPNCFTIPEWKDSISRARSWVSPRNALVSRHKHGSTALNLANGMAGAFIIEGDYDDKLEHFYTKQRVMVIQQYGAVLENLRAANVDQPTELVVVNGQYTPLVHMNPNEMQFWRLINACHQMPVPLDEPKRNQVGADGSGRCAVP